MQPIECASCGTRVLAAKYSARHTSVQWTTEARSSCPQLTRRQSTVSGSGERKTLCPALHASIDAAAESGELALSHRAEPVRGRLG